MENNYGFSLWLECVKDRGEDATPIREEFADGSILLGVFDGLGGSGSTQYNLDGDVRTGAWFASRTVKSAAAIWFRDRAGTGEKFDGKTAAGELQVIFSMLISHIADVLDINPSRLRSKLIRRFPTTCTLMYAVRGDNDWKIHTLHTGDTRAYVLRPELGLQVLTRDDATGYPDALTHLRNGAPMTRCLSADSTNDLSHYSLEVAAPFVLVAASDGCFDYLRHPAELEYVLLSSLMTSSSDAEWAENVSKALGPIAADDVSMAITAVGFAGRENLKTAFGDRLEFLKREFIQPMESASETRGTSEWDALLNKLWQEYSITYEALIPGIPGKEL